MWIIVLRGKLPRVLVAALELYEVVGRRDIDLMPLDDSNGPLKMTKIQAFKHPLLQLKTQDRIIPLSFLQTSLSSAFWSAPVSTSYRPLWFRSLASLSLAESDQRRPSIGYHLNFLSRYKSSSVHQTLP